MDEAPPPPHLFTKNQGKISYRPISTTYFWRSLKGQNLTILETYTELFLLTNPSTNCCGCYPYVRRVLAAEAKFSVDELDSNIERLEKQNAVLHADGHILLRNWFLHHNWISTLTGNVATAVRRELFNLTPLLREEWRKCSIEAGVPEEVIQQFGEASFTTKSGEQAPAKGLQHNNATKQDSNNNNDNKTPEPNAVEDQTNVAFKIELTERGEEFRDIVEAELRGCTSERAQQIADEFCGRLDKSNSNPKFAIDDPRSWLKKLATSTEFVAAHGKALAKNRTKAKAVAQQMALEQEQKKAAEKQRQQKLMEIEQLISQMDDAAIEKTIRKVCESQPPAYANLKPKIEEMLRARKLGEAMVRERIFAAFDATWMAEVDNGQ
jgi:hypothetical protein